MKMRIAKKFILMYFFFLGLDRLKGDIMGTHPHDYSFYVDIFVMTAIILFFNTRMEREKSKEIN